MFDRQFLIALDRLKSRSDATLSHLAEQGIHPELFRGFDWTETGLETRFTYEVDNPGTGYRMDSRTVNLYLSHYTLWKCALYTNGDSFLILEDDARFDPDWRDHLAVAMTFMPADWDILYLGSCCTKDRGHQQVKDRLHRTYHALCTHAYAVRRKALPVMLDKCRAIWTGVDIALVIQVLHHLKAFAILPRIVHQDGTELPD